MINFSLSFGEALDRLSILQIKVLKLTKPEERAKAVAELAELQAAVEGSVDIRDKLIANSFKKLYEANLRMWDAMQEVYDWDGPRDAKFQNLILAIIDENKERAFAKREVDLILKSTHLEAKSFF